MSRMKRSYSDLDQQQQLVAVADVQFAAPPYTSQRGRQHARHQANFQPADAAAAAAGKIKMCMQCGTTRTPQWREGPMGPKTLCNACGVKRVRALKAMQQGRGGHSSHTKKGAANRQAAATAVRTESMDIATTLQMLAGQAAAPPPAKKQARAAHSAGGSSGRSKRATALMTAQQQQQQQHQYTADLAPEDYESPAAAAAAAAPTSNAALLPNAVQRAIAAMAKGSAGGESNPTDSGEEISWSPNGHEAGVEAEGAGRPPINAAAAARRQRQHQLLSHIALQQQQGGQPGAGGGRHSARRQHESAAGFEADEADAAANLLSMSAAAEQHDPAASSKAVVRELIAALAAQGAAGVGASRSRPGAGTPPRPGGRRAAVLKEEDLLYLMGPGMQVLARHVDPQQMLEVVRLNEVLAEAQRGAAAADAAVQAVDKILREKKAAAEVATSSAIAAARQLHTYVSELNSQHALMQRAAQAAVAQAQAAAAAAAAGGRSGRGAVGGLGSRVASQQHLELLSALQQHVKDEYGFEAEQVHQHQEQQRRHQQQQQQQSPEMSPGSDAAAATAGGDEGAAGAGTTPVAHVEAVLGREISFSPLELDEKVGDAAPVVATVQADGQAGDVPGVDLTGPASKQQGPSPAAVHQQEDDANEEDLEVAALLGSLHDLAAVRGGKGSAGQQDQGIEALLGGGSPALL